MVELESCPCCGGDALYVYVPHVGRHTTESMHLDAIGIAVECSKCGLITQGYMSQYEARKAWNRRAE